MNKNVNKLLEQVTACFQERLISAEINRVGELTLELVPERLVEVMTELRDLPDFQFDQLIDVAGIDYSEFGIESEDIDPDDEVRPAQLAAVYHLLSTTHNRRIRLRVAAPEQLPLLESIVDIWPAASWFEREAFDLFGIIFNGHPDLRRILTDYGFIGHPFRKDFPLVGHVEMFYDEEQKRVVYRPVDMQNRITVPKVVRDDHRYESAGD
ncbi:MAG: NADH-quinone oxidoreductase subunit C [Immundisolibacteraceae bacterium]|nr:NADH-quinone oxidoreductase subunit C [Immundisolibacteraceae bacterium]